MDDDVLDPFDQSPLGNPVDQLLQQLPVPLDPNVLDLEVGQKGVAVLSQQKRVGLAQLPPGQLHIIFLRQLVERVVEVQHALECVLVDPQLNCLEVDSEEVLCGLSDVLLVNFT